MTWTTTATLPPRETGPGWTTTATLPPRQTGPGWYTPAGIEKVAAFNSSGTLAVAAGTNYPYSTAAFRSVGTLTATVEPVKIGAAALAATGTLTAAWVETKTVAAAFSAASGLLVTVNEDLTATVGGGVRWTEGLMAGIVQIGGEDGLTATIAAVP